MQSSAADAKPRAFAIWSLVILWSLAVGAWSFNIAPFARSSYFRASTENSQES
jgi:hypothetical protein